MRRWIDGQVEGKAIESGREGNKRQHKTNTFQIFLLIFTLLSLAEAGRPLFSSTPLSLAVTLQIFTFLYLSNIQRKFIFL